MTRPDALVPMGELGRAVGLKGDIRLKSFTGDPAAIRDYGPLVTTDGRTILIASLRPVPGERDMFVARLEGIASREAAEALNRVVLHVPRAKLKLPADPDEFLQADLIGLEVRGPDGARLGRVVTVATYGAGDVLDVETSPGAPTVLVPFQKGFVPEVDVAGGFLVLADAELVAVEPPKPKPIKLRDRGPKGEAR
jgi:16S rRNA processing protein RimM